MLRSALTALAASALLASASASPAAAPPTVLVEAVSAPPQFASGGKVLVRIKAANGPFVVTLNGRDVSDSFVGGSGAEGLITGLRLGDNRIEVSQGRERSVLTVRNYPLEGPILSGPHMKPFVCQTQDFKLPDGSPLGPALNADCFAATKVQYLYKVKGASGLKPLANPTATPADADTATTLAGATVPFVVRVETGVINRAI